ncbi:hypothetical protein [Actinospica sp.]|jgi:hypothetical protein|uniref:hypothetical protein n=1 Tax=Actinospica sp. TaxID=1872142 RepID=UPI002BB85C13|nr:hypothetical protein [Actinospica sp.]HWG26095.1 hypothetical protein [Actinospica sp.]
MPFKNYSLTKNGQLTIGQIFSPDFITGVSGWEIRKDGSAEFNNLGIRGTFSGTDYVINSAGAFFYNGTPGPGTLLISLATAAGTDTYGNAYPLGLQVLQGIISGSEFMGTNWLEDPDGMFMYDGPPATGNLLLSVAPLPGTDTFGNAYQAGVWAYFGGDSVGLFNQGSSPALIFNPVSATLSQGAEAFAFTTAHGLVTEQAWLAVSSGKESGKADAAIQFVSESSDGTIPPSMIFEFGGADAVTLTAANGFTADSWHNITLDSGWSASVTPQYRLLPDGNVQVRGQITHAGVTALTTINNSNPVPAAYRPAATRVYRPPIAGDSAGTVEITSAGILAMRASGFTATAAFLDGEYSL